MARIVLCRHTQTDDNLHEIYSGQRNTPLNDQGLWQANQLSHEVASEYAGRIGLVLSSDLDRARVLGGRLATALRVQPAFDRRMREVDIGAMTGMTKVDAIERYPAPEFRTTNPLFDFSHIDGETAAEVISRQRHSIMEHIDRLEEGKLLVVVGHGSALRLLFVHHLKHLVRLHEQGEYQEVAW